MAWGWPIIRPQSNSAVGLECLAQQDGGHAKIECSEENALFHDTSFCQSRYDYFEGETKPNAITWWSLFSGMNSGNPTRRTVSPPGFRVIWWVLFVAVLLSIPVLAEPWTYVALARLWFQNMQSHGSALTSAEEPVHFFLFPAHCLTLFHVLDIFCFIIYITCFRSVPVVRKWTRNLRRKIRKCVPAK